MKQQVKSFLKMYENPTFSTENIDFKAIKVCVIFITQETWALGLTRLSVMHITPKIGGKTFCVLYITPKKMASTASSRPN